MATLQQTVDSARNLINEPLSTSRTFPDNSSSFWTDSVLSDYYNLVSEELFRELVDLDESYFVTNTNLTIVNGTAEYTLPTDFYKMKRVEDIRTSNNAEIVPIKLSQKGNVISDIISVHTNREAFANGYYILGNRIIFDVTPNFDGTNAIRIDYVKEYTRISAGSDSNVIPDTFNNIIVFQGAHRRMTF